MTSHKKHFLSVIIPVYNDADNLAICLEAIKNQTLEKSNFEIIVVDNGSLDDIDNLKKVYKDVRFLYETNKGSYAARNKGILESKGDILAFTDSDCIPHNDWLEKGLSLLQQDTQVDITAGKVSFFVINKGNMTGVELWEMSYKYKQEYCVNEMNFGLTANLFVRRDVIERVGTFNQDLKSAGDFEWGNRAHECGYKIRYDREILVDHPARRTLGELGRKIRRLIGGQLEVGILSKADAIKKIVTDIFPPVISTYRLLNSGEFKSLNSASYKLKFILIYLYVRYVTVYELIRLVLGGKPVR